MKSLINGASALALACAAILPAEAQESAGRTAYAEPGISPDGQMIAFVSGGDIWEVPAAGGTARLIVSDDATEGRPLYSPDGSKLAFTSTRDGGNANVYVLDFATGTVTRLTWAEGNEELDAWSRDGKWIYFASANQDVGRFTDVFRVPVTGGTPMQITRESYSAEFQAAPSPDGSKVALLARGSMAAPQYWREGHSHIDETELWLKDLANDGGYTRIDAPEAKQAWPMWAPDGASITYMSDKSGTENLWQVPATGGAARQLTQFTDGRLLFPQMAANGSAIVFERDFGIWRFDPASGQSGRVPITLRGAPAGEQGGMRSFGEFSRLAVAPDGKKLAVIAHGELYALPSKDGVPQRITTTPGAEGAPSWSPDSKRLLYTGERGTEQWLFEYDVAAGKETALTRSGQADLPHYSPDGNSAVYVRDLHDLRLVTLPRGNAPASERTLYTGNIDPTWVPAPVFSPDGRWVAFATIDNKSFANIHVVPVAGGTARPVSFLANGQIAGLTWSPDGKYILFDTGQRSEGQQIVRIDLTPHLPAYREDVFADLFKTDATPGDPDKPEGGKAKPAKDAKPADKKIAPVEIVWDGLRDRATVVPIGFSGVRPMISSDGKTLIFNAVDRGQDNLYSYSLDELASEPAVAKQLTATPKPKGDFALTADGKTLYYLDGGRIFSTPLENPKPAAVPAGVEMNIDFDAEKQATFDEAWSLLNTYFFDPKFNGKDWAALRAKYQPLVTGARTGDEMRRAIGLMIGELNASHSGIGKPGQARPNRVGNIGLSFDRAAYEAGRGLVVREVVDLGPADVSGKIAPGDRLVSVNDTDIGAANVDRLLEGTVGKQTTLGVVGADGSRRTVTVQPVSSSTASGLRYRAWVDERRALVDKLSGGRLGYVHMLDMSDSSLQQLYLDLDAANQGKQGVVVDVRNNNGGFVNGYALDVLSRHNYMMMTPRGLPALPARQALGQRALGLPTVLLTNENTLSDGEDFSAGYRALQLGKIVGQPTAGWIIYTSNTPLIDGSVVRVPSVRIHGVDNEDWEMNPRPVDIAVEQPLGDDAKGQDSQLAAAVKTLLGQIGGN